MGRMQFTSYTVPATEEGRRGIALKAINFPPWKTENAVLSERVRQQRNRLVPDDEKDRDLSLSLISMVIVMEYAASEYR